MAVKLFLLGRPGSGKSTAARRMMKLARWPNWSFTHIHDYEVLHQWFALEKNNHENGHKYFLPREHNGFDVIEFSILRLALEEVNRRAQEQILLGKKLVLIEFARDDYSEVLRIFSRQLLDNAYFLFFDASIDACIHRIHARSLRPMTNHDHFVSDEMISRYYQQDNTEYIISQLAKDYHLDGTRVKVINTMGSLDDFIQKINKFFEGLLEKEPSVTPQTNFSSDIFLKQQPKGGRHDSCEEEYAAPAHNTTRQPLLRVCP